MIPPKHSAEFVADMENVLQIYQRPCDEQHPVVCMDEQPLQLIAETRAPLPMQPGKPLRYDHEYSRAGTANIFMFTEPLAGWRRVSVRERKTMVDWAEEVHQLLTIDYPRAEKVTLICDQLNTHRIASLYERFEPEVASSLASRLDLQHTPKHGSWLNVAEIELSVLSRQCLSRRIDCLPTLKRQTTAWATTRNKAQTGVDWQFKSENARIKLKHLYPKAKLG